MSPDDFGRAASGVILIAMIFIAGLIGSWAFVETATWIGEWRARRLKKR
jgi:hypothetical protein